jgi:hypothetical protein
MTFWAFVGFWSSRCTSWGLGFELQHLCFLVDNWLIKGKIEKSSGQFLSLIMMSHWLDKVWIQIWDILIVLSLSFGLCGASHLLVPWCAGDRCGMACNDEDCGRSRRHGAEDRECSQRSSTRWPGDWEVRWHCVRSTLCTWRWETRLFWLSLKTKVDCLSVIWPQNYWDGLSVVWPQNHWDSFSYFGFKIGGDGFSQFDLKTGGLGFLVVPQNQSRWFINVLASKPLRQFLLIWLQNRWRRFLSVWPQNRWHGFSDLGLKTCSSGLVI